MNFCTLNWDYTDTVATSASLLPWPRLHYLAIISVPCDTSQPAMGIGDIIPGGGLQQSRVDH